jgi:predicted transcriptional regulator
MKIPVYIRLDPDVKKRAEQAAAREDRSLSAWMARAVAASLAEAEALPAAKAPTKRKAAKAPAKRKAAK